ncbi:hypothetical protein I5S84_11500 [Pseudomonas putida]|uniref:hypothetical protein n=1 Tax=Pseudomonas putida TaxID=303 RepID=UPI0018D6B8F5|nr:hypothetical protein [Pseudomonas putida]MBH3449476.1 hypothetical protein [Pseudomonas putida]
MAYNTNNQLGSSDPRDLFDNSANFDEGMGSTAESFLDRFGRPRATWQKFHNLTINAESQIGETVTTAKARVNAAADAGIEDIDESVAAVDAAEAAAISQMEETAADLGEDIGNKGFDDYAEMLAYTPKYDGVLAWVHSDPVASLNGFYQWDAESGAWVKPSPQMALDSDIKALLKLVSAQVRPRGKRTGNAPLIFGVGGAQVLLGVDQKVPRGPQDRRGANAMLGSTPILPMIPLQRPRSKNFTADTLVMSGSSVMMQSGAQSSGITPSSSYDAKVIEEQNQKPAPKTMAGLVDGQVWEYGPLGSRQLTSVGTWLAAQAVAFDMVKALKSTSGAPQPHSIVRDGRILRDGQVLLHKLVTGQSLALGSRGIILDPNGTIVIDGKTGRLFTPYTLAGYADKLFTLPGGPRPTSWVGATALDPIREYAAGVAAETPASSYMLAYRRWHERTSSIDPRMLYSISALGGTAYAGLKKGTTTYTNAIAHVTAAKAIADANGWDYQVPSLSIVHGESQISTTQAEYVAMLAEWISDYRTDIVAITGQAVPPVAFISQMLTGETGTIPAIPLAQLQAHNDNPNIVMVGPKYAYGYFDTYHMLAEGYAKMGELEARAERLTQVSGKWQPLKVASASVSGSTITLKMNNLPNGNAGTPGPIGNLVLDTETVKDPGNAGFLLSAGTITSVAVGADGATLVIGTAAAVTAGTVLTYALQPSLSSPQNGSGRRGCIRDTDMRDYSRYDNKPLFNWLCAFSLALEL